MTKRSRRVGFGAGADSYRSKLGGVDWLKMISSRLLGSSHLSNAIRVRYDLLIELPRWWCARVADTVCHGVRKMLATRWPEGL